MKLYRSTEDRQLAGVCGGLAAVFDWSPTRLRVVWVLLAIFTGGGAVITYLALWYLMPKAPGVAQPFEPALLQPWKK
jgi:phage shock protein PspC (stress-responsive transcriptional regulator)